MNVLEKMGWLHSTVKDLESENETSREAAKLVIRHYAEDIARALVSVAYTEDEVIAEVQAKLISRSKQGMLTYGVSMEDHDLPITDWINHAVEEALDFANYLTKLKRVLSEQDT